MEPFSTVIPLHLLNFLFVLYPGVRSFIVFAALVAAPAEIIEEGAKAGLSTLAQTLLGAITLLSLGVAVLAVWKLSKVQDLRAADAERSAQRIEKTNERMINAFSEMKHTMEALAEAEKTGQRLVQDQNNLLQQLKGTFDTVIRDAVLRGGRSYTPEGTVRRPHGGG